MLWADVPFSDIIEICFILIKKKKENKQIN